MIQDLDEGFQEVFIELQAVRELLILVGVDIGKDMRFWRSVSRGTTIEVLNRGLENLVIEAKDLSEKELNR